MGSHRKPTPTPRLSRILSVVLSVLTGSFAGCSFPTTNEPFPSTSDPSLSFLSVTLSNPIESLQPVNPVITLSFCDIIYTDTG